MNTIQRIVSLALVAGASLALTAAPLVLNGAGASFPAPVYQQWTNTYNESSKGVKVNYQSIGSGAGLNQLYSETVDFAGTDNPLTAQDQEDKGVVQFPMLTGGVVVIYNLPGIPDGALKLTGDALAKIYLGEIQSWNDPALQALNPTLKLPARKITVVRRADASGTSFIFTNYLSKVSQTWNEKVGAGSAVRWPVGLGGQKNPGVCNNVAKIQGSIGYTEYTYALEAKLSMAQLQNAAGNFLAPSQETFSASAAGADWKNAPGLFMVLTNQPGEKSWPITGVTYIVYHKNCPPERKAALAAFFRWCFTEGSDAARKLQYVPIPQNVVDIFADDLL